jgi:hypothetical protein
MDIFDGILSRLDGSYVDARGAKSHLSEALLRLSADALVIIKVPLLHLILFFQDLNVNDVHNCFDLRADSLVYAGRRR